ncbi:hypothetical protein DFH09DRAFT_1280168 [Mycena vulgaris]|nr:hypothetical protein DFH09DRAFT_1280168 [Mycena vulgaris]
MRESPGLGPGQAKPSPPGEDVKPEPTQVRPKPRLSGQAGPSVSLDRRGGARTSRRAERGETAQRSHAAMSSGLGVRADSASVPEEALAVVAAGASESGRGGRRRGEGEVVRGVAGDTSLVSIQQGGARSTRGWAVEIIAAASSSVWKRRGGSEGLDGDYFGGINTRAPGLGRLLVPWRLSRSTTAASRCPPTEESLDFGLAHGFDAGASTFVRTFLARPKKSFVIIQTLGYGPSRDENGLIEEGHTRLTRARAITSCVLSLRSLDSFKLA